MSSPWKQPQCLQLVNRSLTPANVVTMETATMSLQFNQSFTPANVVTMETATMSTTV